MQTHFYMIMYLKQTDKQQHKYHDKNGNVLLKEL